MRYEKLISFKTATFTQVRDQTWPTLAIGIALQPGKGCQILTSLASVNAGGMVVVWSVPRQAGALRLTKKRNPGNVRGNSQPGQSICAHAQAVN